MSSNGLHSGAQLHVPSRFGKAAVPTGHHVLCGHHDIAEFSLVLLKGQVDNIEARRQLCGALFPGKAQLVQFLHTLWVAEDEFVLLANLLYNGSQLQPLQFLRPLNTIPIKYLIRKIEICG